MQNNNPKNTDSINEILSSIDDLKRRMNSYEKEDIKNGVLLARLDERIGFLVEAVKGFSGSHVTKEEFDPIKRKVNLIDKVVVTTIILAVLGTIIISNPN